MKRLAKYWWILAGLAVFGSYFAIRTAIVVVQNPSPTELTCAQLIEGRPSAEWLRIRECEPRLEEITYESHKYSDMVSEVYVPYGPPGTEDIAIIVRTDDTRWIAFVKAANTDAEAVATPPDFDALLASTTIEGLSDYQSTEDADEIRAVMGTDKDHPLMKAGEKPSWGLLAYQFGLVFLFGLGAVVGARRRLRAPSESTSTPVP